VGAGPKICKNMVRKFARSKFRGPQVGAINSVQVCLGTFWLIEFPRSGTQIRRRISIKRLQLQSTSYSERANQASTAWLKIITDLFLVKRYVISCHLAV